MEETLSYHRRWWLANKDDPRIRAGFRASTKKYYEKNKEAERARKREYYHKKKLLASQTPAPAPAPEEPPA